VHEFMCKDRRTCLAPPLRFRTVPYIGWQVNYIDVLMEHYRDNYHSGGDRGNVCLDVLVTHSFNEWLVCHAKGPCASS
jgi:hypothetical protein